MLTLACVKCGNFASNDAIFSPNARELFGPLAVTMFPSAVARMKDEIEEMYRVKQAV